MFLGIDFGTSNSSAALMIDERPRLVKEPVKQGYSFPSSIYLTEEGEILVGQIAENRKFLDLTRYRREFKKDLLQNTPYFLGSQGEYEFTPQKLITEVIKTLKKEADKITTSLGRENVTNAVVTIPASYKKNKKDLMKEAAQKAGFTSVNLLEEPVAAAIYYNHQNPATFQEGDVILIYDLGGGTFDATLIKKIGKNFQILGQPVGIENCGGINFDRAIFENLKSFCNTKSQNGLNSIDKNQKNLLLDFCRDIKHQFSSYTNAAGQIPISGQTYQLAVSDFNRKIAFYTEQTLDICENLIKSAGLEIQDINRVLMVGGSCRIPYIQESIKQRLETSVLLVDEPELAVCQGAVIYGSKLEVKSVKQNIVLPYQHPKENFNFAENIKITMLGNKGAGKTTFMLAMYAIMSEGVNGFSLCTEDLDDHIDLIDKWENLLHGEGEERWPTANSEADYINYSFNFNYAVTNNLIKFDWLDYPGGALDEKEKKSDSKDVAEIHQRLKESDCIFICVSGEYLKDASNKTLLPRASGARRIKKLIISNAFQEKPPIPIVIVVTKYDLCQQISQQELINLIKQNFDNFFDDFFIEEGQWRIMICPVTLGQTLYQDSNRGGIKPMNVHLPLMFAVFIKLKQMLFNIDNSIILLKEKWEQFYQRIEIRRKISSFLFSATSESIFIPKIKATEEEIRQLEKKKEIIVQLIKLLSNEIGQISFYQRNEEITSNF